MWLPSSSSRRIEGLESESRKRSMGRRGPLRNECSCEEEMRKALNEVGVLSTKR